MKKDLIVSAIGAVLGASASAILGYYTQNSLKMVIYVTIICLVVIMITCSFVSYINRKKVFKTIHFKVELPVIEGVKYNLFFVQRGKAGMLLDDQTLLQDGNKRIPLACEQYTDETYLTGIYSAKIKNITNAGFQFKLFAECRGDANIGDTINQIQDFFEEDYNEKVDFRDNIVKDEGRIFYIYKKNENSVRFELVKQASQKEKEVWFVLPSFRVYVTPDELHPYLNNYYDVNDRE